LKIWKKIKSFQKLVSIPWWPKLFISQKFLRDNFRLVFLEFASGFSGRINIFFSTINTNFNIFHVPFFPQTHRSVLIILFYQICTY
jgi:hypothetical protein